MVMPGISVEEIIKNMNRNSLRKLLGEKLYGTLAQLSLDEVDVNDLRNVAQVLYCNNNPRAIKDEKLRHQLIDALPFSKAEELGALLKLNARDNIYEKLKHIKFSDRQDIESLFLNFLGLLQKRQLNK